MGNYLRRMIGTPRAFMRQMRQPRGKRGMRLASGLSYGSEST
ncbi:hypothetical protein [Clostridium sp. AF12-41]|nr:hypothetical protein [Clostridium sp. AF12-41]